MNYTTIEQSKKLLDLGLNPNTADMWYHGHRSPWESGRKYDNEPSTFYGICPNWDYPCWSVGALLKLLRSYEDCTSLSIFSNRAQKWQITISYYDAVWKEHEEVDMDLFEVSYNTVVWLLENGYIKTEKI